MKKRKINYTKVIVFFVFLSISIFGVSQLFSKVSPKILTKTFDKYLANNNITLDIYTLEEEKLVKKETLNRGTKIKTSNKVKTIENKEYMEITYNNNNYLVLKENVVEKEESVVLEKEIYIRTATSVLDENNKPISLVEKGSKVEVLSYDILKKDGTVNKYKIKVNDIEGYVYGKYTVFDEESSKKHYDQTTIDNVHSKIKNTYNGGDPTKLDYYPYEKGNFKDNVMPEHVYSLYMNAGSNVINNVDKYIEFAKDININAFVVDIKDNQTPAYPSKVMETYSPTNFSKAINSYDNYKNAITKLKEAGFYVIGRITTFKDSYYVQDHPEDSIKSISNSMPYYHTGAYWPSPYDRDVWYFNVELAKEAVTEFGFNEINFDYVRFPDRMQKVESLVDMNNVYNEDKTQAIQRFVMYACDTLHELNAYVSIDVFGESTNDSYTTAYGQYWPAISNIADVMSGMPYPDHFSKGYYGLEKPWNSPYELMLNWGKAAYDRQKETTTPAKVRTWIQAYDVLKYVDPNGISYNAEALEKEIRGLYEAKVGDGYITWLSNSNLEKYKLQKDAFKIDYGKEYNNENN